MTWAAWQDRISCSTLAEAVPFTLSGCSGSTPAGCPLGLVTFIVTTALLVANPVAAQPPCCWLSFAEAKSANLARDLSDRGRDGVVHGVRWVDGNRFGSGLWFGGQGQYVEVKASRELHGTDGLTIFAVVRVEDIIAPPGSVGAIVAKWRPTGNPQDMSWALVREESTFRLRLSDGKKQYRLDALVPDTGWHQLAAAFDGKSARLYLDGKLQARQEAAMQLQRTPSAIRLGSASSGNWWFQGMIRTVKIWDVALSESRIASEVTAERMIVGPSAASEAPAGELSVKSIPAIPRDNVVLPAERNLRIVPEPQHLRRTAGVFEIDAETRIVTGDPEGVAVVTLQSQLQDMCGLRLKVPKGNTANAGAITIGAIDMLPKVAPQLRAICPDCDALNDEGYVLTCNASGIVVAGKTPRGTFYGVQTLLQLLSVRDDRVIVPGVSVVDWPAMRWRGMHVSLRVAGQKTNINLLKDLITRVWARYKFNTLVLEIEGGMQFESHPEISHPLALTKAEMCQIVRWAKRHYLEVIPQIQTLGHCGSWLLKAHPELAEDPKMPFNYDPANPKVYPLLFDLFEEVIEVFAPRYFHIGHDEVRGVLGTMPTWKGRPSHEWFARDVTRLHGFLKERGIRTMMWGDMLLRKEEFPRADAAHGGGQADIARALDAVPKDILICDWHYTNAARYPTLKYFRDQGFDVVATPWFSRANNFHMAVAAQDAGALGMLGSRWEGNQFAVDQAAAGRSNGFLLAAEYAWSPGKPPLHELPDETEITQRLALDLFRPKAQDSGLLLDLSLLANATLTAEQEWLFYPGTVERSPALPVGTRRLDGVLFHLTQERGYPKAIVLSGRASQSFPAAARIPVRAKVSRLYLLHACGWLVPQAGKELAFYELRYADGTRDRLPIVGNDASQLKLRAGSPGSVTNASSDRRLALWTTIWHNRWPDREVSEIVFRSAATATPILLAVTAAIERDRSCP